MDEAGDHFLNSEYCFFDGKRKRCRDFVTLTASVYHPLLRKQVPLATMETKKEDTENIELFWTLFNEAISKAISSLDSITYRRRLGTGTYGSTEGRFSPTDKRAVVKSCFTEHQFLFSSRLAWFSSRSCRCGRSMVHESHLACSGQRQLNISKFYGVLSSVAFASFPGLSIYSPHPGWPLYNFPCFCWYCRRLKLLIFA